LGGAFLVVSALGSSGWPARNWGLCQSQCPAESSSPTSQVLAPRLTSLFLSPRGALMSGFGLAAAIAPNLLLLIGVAKSFVHSFHVGRRERPFTASDAKPSNLRSGASLHPSISRAIRSDLLATGIARVHPRFLAGQKARTPLGGYPTPILETPQADTKQPLHSLSSEQSHQKTSMDNAPKYIRTYAECESKFLASAIKASRAVMVTRVPGTCPDAVVTMFSPRPLWFHASIRLLVSCPSNHFRKRMPSGFWLLALPTGCYA
jgi:hypothetical protein